MVYTHLTMKELSWIETYYDTGLKADILLLDEPFGALDALNREVSQQLFFTVVERSSGDYTFDYS